MYELGNAKQGEELDELLRIRAEIAAALEEVDEVVAAATQADPR